MPPVLPKTLLSTAVLGTARQALNPLADPAIEAVLGRLDPNDQAARLLLAAAAIAVQQKAGWLAVHDTRPLPPPCPAETMPACGSRAWQHLLLMLKGQYSEALPEWLQAVARAGKRVPEEALTPLLTLGAKQHALRDAIWPVIGQRGAWLAEQPRDRSWQWAAPPTVDRWASWSSETRAAALEAWRRTDPGAARDFLQDKLAGEDWESRTNLLNCLAVGLSPDDESFLESRLADNSQGVRHAVAELLGQLPGSQLSQRMTERATRFVTLGWKGLPRKPVIEVTLPNELDADMIRDGLLPSVPFLGKEATAAQSWLAQFLSCQSLSFWVSHWQLPIGGVLDGGHNSKESNVLFSAWAEAIKREHDAGFMAELLTVLFRHEKNEKKKGVEAAQLQLAAVRHYAGPWTDDLTDAFVRGLQTYLGQGNRRPPPETRQMLQTAMYRMPTTNRDKLAETLRGLSTDKSWTDLVYDFELVLTFRQEMLAAIWPDSPDSEDLSATAGATP